MAEKARTMTPTGIRAADQSITPVIAESAAPPPTMRIPATKRDTPIRFQAFASCSLSEAGLTFAADAGSNSWDNPMPRNML